MKLKALTAAILGTAALCQPLAMQADDKPQFLHFYDSNGGVIRFSALSDNGRYAVGSKLGDQEVDNPHSVGGMVYDLETNAFTTISSAYDWATVSDVSDDGLVVGNEGGQPAYWSKDTGKWTIFPTEGRWDYGCFMAVTPDGKYAVGYLGMSADALSAKPMMYNLQTGEEVAITNLPEVDLSGEDQNQNVFYGISADGRYVLGQMSQSYWLPVSPVTYVYDVQQQTWSAVGFSYNAASKTYSPLVEGLHFIISQYMSCDGQWVAGTAYMVLNDGQMMGGEEFEAPFRYNVSTGQTEIFTGADDQNISGNKITADGVVLGSMPSSNPYPTAVVRSGKYFISLDQIFSQVYHTSLYSHIGDGTTGAFEALSADGLTSVMATYDNCYILRMPEAFADAAAKVDLLANYIPSIPENSRISKIGEVKIAFERAIAVSNQPSAVKLLDADGNTVRQASGFTVSAANDHELVVTFRTTALEPGKQYAIVIPEGMVWLKDDSSVKAREIRLSYVGRNAGALQVSRITPADGSSVAQINSNPDYIAVTFDAPVAVSANAACTLYNADDDAVVASLMCSAAGNQAIFYPTAAYYLYRGTNYKVVISAGSVTDLSGDGANEEIVLNYQGAYVRELSSDDKYIYNNPCENYDNFMMWKSQFNEPCEVAAMWGFTAETMWVLVRDSESSTDQALCAHSMFATPGQADDWISTPQLRIPDASAYLSFDAQSYLKDKQDRLKVYVYECDAVHNNLAEEFVEEMRANGDLVFDELLSPGETQEGLDGEWTHYTIDLADYAGKNIYIAFVNNNFDQSAIFLDNVKVVREMNFFISNNTPERVIDAQSVAVKGVASTGNEMGQYNGIALKLIDAAGEVVDEINDADATLAYGEYYQFEFAKELPVAFGETTEYSISISSGEETTTFDYAVKDLVFEPIHKVVLEEYAGADCGNCPLGIVAIENLESIYPDNFIPVALRTYGSDRYGLGLSDYSAFLGCENVGAPSGRINRGPVLAPMVQTQEGYKFNGRGIIESDGAESYLWADAVQDELNVPAEAEIAATASYDPSTGLLIVPCSVRFALNTAGRSISVFAVVVEDDLPTSQSNYLFQTSDPALGEWGAGGMYGKNKVTTWAASDVVRFVVTGNAFKGVNMAENDFEAGETYNITLNANMDESKVEDLEYCRIVVMLIDGGTERVINANQTAIVLSGISGVEADGDDAPVYYNLQGVKIANPERGHVYIRVANGKASKVVK